LKVFAPIAVFLITGTTSLSQDSSSTDITNVAVLTIVNPGFSYEQKIGKDQSLYGQIFISTSFYLGYSSSLGNTSEIHFDPAFTAQYRYYYNAERRFAKGKRTALNSMNYVSVVYEAIFTDNRISVSDYEEENVRPIHQLGICWGIQRNYASRFSLNLHLGLGYFYTRVTTPDNLGQPVSGHSGGFNTLGQLNLGIWLNKRK
jgi:hypothetical protein